MSAIELRAVEKTWDNGVQALRPLDLRVERGEIVTLLGPSGCGKSSLLNIVAGLTEPSAGDVAVGPDERIGFVFQQATLMPWARVAANVRLPLDLAGVARAEANARAAEALRRVGLGAFAEVWPRELSGGMQMRASIARALVTEPTLLLMDEPFGALDEITRNRLDDELLRVRREQQLTVLFVTHSIHEAVYLSDRVVVMAARPGRVVAEVAITTDEPRDDAFRVSTTFARDARDLQQALLAAARDADEALA